VPRVGDIQIQIDTSIRNCFSQFYIPELNNSIKKGDYILRISSCGKDFHMLCWLYCTDIYGCFFWKYASKSDMEYNIGIGNNKL
jgi:hypothetical protein